MKRFFITLALSMLILPAITAGNINFSVKLNHDWWWNAPEQPEVKISAVNTSNKNEIGDITLTVTTDKYEPVTTMQQTVNVAAGDSSVATFMLNVAPGFYRCTAIGNGNEVKKFNIGFEPENLIALPDAQSDFKEFWDKARAELAKVEPDYHITFDKERTGNDPKRLRNVYDVTMRSLGGDTIRGLLTRPIKNGKYPVIIHYMGYGSKPWNAGTNYNGDFVEFVLSSRGQGMNQPTNKYGDWVVSGLASKDTYYYRGAYMDLVRTIDFVCQLADADTSKIFAEGGSQGGAFTLAACALDHRIKAAAPWIPFLSDFRDYFKIVPWPGNSIFAKQKELGLSDEQLYTTLSYFDIKNLARWIKCPILMGVGLQDPTCPPRTNFSSFNLIDTQKQFVIFPTCGHDTEHPRWDNMQLDFFKKFIKK
jgi:cephalosporin-C deacetylase